MRQRPDSSELSRSVRAISMQFPEATERAMALGFDYRVRNRTFVAVFAIADGKGGEPTFIACRADPIEREVLRSIGHPYFIPGTGRDRVGVVLDGSTDWDEIRELITESYLIAAPKKLAALVAAPPAS